MQLKALKVFCDVVQQRSFSRAADENSISQSGASQLVQQLEDHLGVRLIDRSKRPFVLTPEGDLFYSQCRDIVSRYFALEDKVRTMHQEVIGRVRVAAIYSVGLHLMADYISSFMSAFPKANVRLEYLHPHRVYESVEDDVADIGLVSYPKSSRTIDAVAWREEKMVLACAPQHPLAHRPKIAINELHGHQMVAFDSDLTIRREIDRVLNQHHAEVIVQMEFDNVETIKRAVEINTGVSLLPEPTIRREVDAGTLVSVPLDTEELVRPLGIIVRRGKELSVTAQRLIEHLQRAGRTDGTIASPSTTANKPAEDAATHSARNGNGAISAHGAHGESGSHGDRNGNGASHAASSKTTSV